MAITQNSKLQMYKVLRMLQMIIRCRKRGDLDHEIFSENVKDNANIDKLKTNQGLGAILESGLVADQKSKRPTQGLKGDNDDDFDEAN